ncbi:MAG: hypothetical protein ABSG97_02435 [Sedimentisphaerales bacterium]|jgi:hypothetical protein
MSERSESNGGGGIRNPKAGFTDSEHNPHKSTTKSLQHPTDNDVTKVTIEQKLTLSQQNYNTILREKCALCVPKNRAVNKRLPAELAEIIQAWPTLPEHIKAAIMALIKVR